MFAGIGILPPTKAGSMVKFKTKKHGSHKKGDNLDKVYKDLKTKPSKGRGVGLIVAGSGLTVVGIVLIPFVWPSFPLLILGSGLIGLGSVDVHAKRRELKRQKKYGYVSNPQTYLQQAPANPEGGSNQDQYGQYPQYQPVPPYPMIPQPTQNVISLTHPSYETNLYNEKEQGAPPPIPQRQVHHIYQHLRQKSMNIDGGGSFLQQPQQDVLKSDPGVKPDNGDLPPERKDERSLLHY